MAWTLSPNLKCIDLKNGMTMNMIGRIYAALLSTTPPPRLIAKTLNLSQKTMKIQVFCNLRGNCDNYN